MQPCSVDSKRRYGLDDVFASVIPRAGAVTRPYIRNTFPVHAIAPYFASFKLRPLALSLTESPMPTHLDRDRRRGTLEHGHGAQREMVRTPNWIRYAARTINPIAGQERHLGDDCDVGQEI